MNNYTNYIIIQYILIWSHVFYSIPEQIATRMVPLIRSEFQRLIQEQKSVLDGALLAVQVRDII